METQALERELKRGSTELLLLALLEERTRHGYEIARLIDERSRGLISFHAASLYPTLYRLEGRVGLTTAGKKALASQRSLWEGFFEALNRVAHLGHA